MSQKIDNLRTNLQTKLKAISNQLNTVKTHLETSSKEVESSIHVKLDVAKAKLAAKKQEIINKVGCSRADILNSWVIASTCLISSFLPIDYENKESPEF